MDAEEKKSRILSELVVTIDGPSGSGKSTTASSLARRLGLTYLDTGAMYRTVTLAVLRAGIDPEDEEAVTSIAESIDISIEKGEDGPVLLLDGEEVGNAIRGADVSSAVSPVSRYPGVRKAMVRIQRSVARSGGIVAEGRDTGTTVFPYAHVKVFLVADITTRAKRRVQQLSSMGMEQDIGAIEKNLSERDRIDSGREHSPLLRPPGSILVDTSSISIEEQVSIIEEEALRTAERLSELRVWDRERNPFAAKKLYYAISHTAVAWLMRLVFGLRVIGAENLRYRENFLVASNHISYMDPLVAGCAVNRELWFLAKKELFSKKFLGWLVRKYHAISISRGEPDRKSLRTIMETLKSGHSVLMFPEGTRSKTGEILPAKQGLSFVAFMTGSSILPLHITGARNMRQCLLRKRKLEVRLGRPIRLGSHYRSEDRKKDYAVLADMVREALRMLQDEAKA